ncbi:hypothetical protein RRSWK_02671 [Rhodopirellula sp. SWK7]|nr:hypothetical protein RRSWK_02671 [Rhodopirellula sp. SWK7]
MIVNLGIWGFLVSFSRFVAIPIATAGCSIRLSLTCVVRFISLRPSQKGQLQHV